MKTLLVLDMWRSAGGGTSKLTLYQELSQLFVLKFASPRTSLLSTLEPYLRSFHPVLAEWKARKARLEETMPKRPRSFRQATEAWNQALRYATGYDAVLQVGSLFGPVDVPKAVPYFTYHDSVVAMVERMWPPWLPDDFARYRDEWYGLERQLLRTITAAMTYSRFVKDCLVRDYGVDTTHVHVVGSALKMLDGLSSCTRQGGQQAVFVSTDFHRKGGNDVLRIFDEVIRDLPQARLTIVGRVPKEVELTGRSWLRAPGSLSKGELAQVYQAANVMIHPAYYDPFPSVILEAANFQVPCVASSICGIPEIIEDGVTGLLAVPGDVSGFARKVVEILQNEEAAIKMGSRAKTWVREKYHPSVVAGNIGTVINSHFL
jgi:glycosyltransferase involved in cell wall biosynthesis